MIFLKVWLIWLLIDLTYAQVWNTLYDFHNETIYLLPESSSSLIQIPFNAKFKSGDVIGDKSLGNLISVPEGDVMLLGDGDLYSVQNNTGFIKIQKYKRNQKIWEDVELKNNTIPYYSLSGLVSTFEEPTAIYIYGGLNTAGQDETTDETVAERLLKIDISNGISQELNSSVQPAAFYGSSNFPINDNTVLLVGGKAQKGWISFSQMAIWQYETWSFKKPILEDSINSRMSPLLLPVFHANTSSSEPSDHKVESLLMLGGTLLDGVATPSFSQLNISSTDWVWQSLDKAISTVNSLKNSPDNEISPSNLTGAAIVYDTLLVVNQTETDQYRAYLYNTQSFEHIASVDYTKADKKTSSKNTSRPLVIAVSTIVPVLGIILSIVVSVVLVKKYNKKKEMKQREKEISNYMAFFGGSKSDNLPTPIKLNNTDDELSIDLTNRKGNTISKRRSVKMLRLPSLTNMFLDKRTSEISFSSQETEFNKEDDIPKSLYSNSTGTESTITKNSDSSDSMAVVSARPLSTLRIVNPDEPSIIEEEDADDTNTNSDNEEIISSFSKDIMTIMNNMKL
ncbi:BA75_02520T0 [Komagataella pastoris]|uniref:BA75_02520T0 n=1 Tax=Komagataella pastoris TaxID=4922 RepID=A0A1B2JE07_PICPA|nr:BA75_02520T0 [Komagataella pastoris]